MQSIRRARNAIAIGIGFLVTGLAFGALAGPAGYAVDLAGVTMLVALGAALGLMAYILIVGSPRD